MAASSRRRHRTRSSRGDRLLRYALENRELANVEGEELVLDDPSVLARLESIETSESMVAPNCPCASMGMQQPCMRPRITSSDDADHFVEYKTTDVYPEWIIKHDVYDGVDRIVRKEQLYQALVTQPQARTLKQIDLLEVYLLTVWPTAERLGSPGVKEIAKTARFQRALNGEFIVREGERGTAFYILLSGTLEVLKRDAPERIAVLKPGSSFGEASLGAGAPPRNASIVSLVDDAQLLVLHKADYDSIMRDFQAAEHRKAFKCIKHVPIFAHWSRTRLHQVCNMLQWHHFKCGDIIVKQGDPCANVYFIIQGKCEVAKDVYVQNTNRWPAGKRKWVTKTCTATVNVKLMELGPGDYFGEKGILENSKRAATVTARDDAVLVSLDRVAFVGLLDRGPQNRLVHVSHYAGASNLGYATEQEIISVMNAMGSKHDANALQQARSSKQVSVAGKLVNHNAATATALSLFATGDFSPSKFLTLHDESSQNSERPGARENTSERLIDALDEDTSAESGLSDDCSVATKAIPTRESARHNAEVERARLKIDERLRQHRQQVGKHASGASARAHRLLPYRALDEGPLGASLGTLSSPSMRLGIKSLTRRPLCPRDDRERRDRAITICVNVTDDDGRHHTASRFLDAVCAASATERGARACPSSSLSPLHVRT